jgi:hypothetical protein
LHGVVAENEFTWKSEFNNDTQINEWKK